MKTKKTIKLHSKQYGNERVIEIIVAQENMFLSCLHGSDLNDLDILIQTFLPDIDFEEIDYEIARNLEKKLYCMLCAYTQASMMKRAFFDFLDHVENQYCKRPSATSQSSVKTMMQNTSQGSFEISFFCFLNMPVRLFTELRRSFGAKRSLLKSIAANKIRI